jgi:predicted short-subunit dehydrogenase-like oxidoreductase (DUF2520 family)
MLLTMLKKDGRKRPRIALVGAGKLGTALAVSLHAAGYAISEIVSRNRKSSERKAMALSKRVGGSVARSGNAALQGDVVWFCVPDDEIAEAARGLAGGNWEGRIAVHSSGALTSDVLEVLRGRGAQVVSAHPMMTFVEGILPELKGTGFAIEGERRAVAVVKRIVRRLGGETFAIAKKDKALYHAWGTFLSPLLTSLLAAGEEVAIRAGVTSRMARRWMLPIVRQTVENYVRQGGARGFSGPIVRGDAATVRKHLQVLERHPARDVYVALARSALRTLPARNPRHLKSLLR